MQVFGNWKTSQTGQLNGSDIRDSERKDAEKYYLQQCYSEYQHLLAANDESEKQRFLEENPRYTELLDIYGTPVLSGSTDDPETLAGGLIGESNYFHFEKENLTNFEQI